MPYTLAIDYGTSFTAAAILSDGKQPTSLEVEGYYRLPSLVYLSDSGRLVTGLAAMNQAGSEPTRCAFTPKRDLGVVNSTTLGTDVVPIADLIAAVLEMVVAEAIRHHGGEEPASVILTHPAGWQERLTGLLVEAAAQAGIKEPELLAEPVAAAMYYAGDRIEPGSYVGVYDLGGGTFDTAVLQRTETGFQLAGPTGGDTALGGEMFDDLLCQYAQERLANEQPDLAPKVFGPTADPRMAAWFRSSISEAKEHLSSYESALIILQLPFEGDLVITREQFEALVRTHLERTAELLEQTIADANLDPDDLQAIYLAGGSSRIPLAKDVLESRFRAPCTTYGEPKRVVSLGALKASQLDETPADDVAGIIHQVGQVAKKAGLEAAADDLEREALAPESSLTTLVVIGETKRGKSSLINALLDAPDLLPVDADIATSTHLQVTYGPDQQVTRLTRDGRRTRIAPTDLRLYASMKGDPDLVAETEAIEITLPHPLLERGLSIVDTPGVGGLEAGHSEIALASLRDADALLFVTDASAPMYASEQAFLSRAAERIETVFFALTKTDLFPDHLTIEAENRELIRANAPRFSDAPVFPVGSQLKLESSDLAAKGDGDARTLADLSGYSALAEALTEGVVGRSESLRAANLLRAAQHVLKLVQSHEQIRRRSAEDDADVVEDLAELEDRYRALLAPDAPWEVELNRAIDQRRPHLEAELNQIGDLAQRYGARAENGEPLLELLDDLMTALKGRWLDMEKAGQDAVLDELEQTCGALAADGVNLLGDSVSVPQRTHNIDFSGARAEASAILAGAIRSADAPPAKTATLWESYNSMSTSEKVLSIGVTLFFFWPALPSMVAWKKFKSYTETRKANAEISSSAAEAAEALTKTAVEAQSAMSDQLEAAIDDTRRLAVHGVRQRLDARLDEVRDGLRTHKSIQNEDQQTKDERVRETEQNLAAAARLLDKTEQLRRELQTKLKWEDRP